MFGHLLNFLFQLLFSLSGLHVKVDMCMFADSAMLLHVTRKRVCLAAKGSQYHVLLLFSRTCVSTRTPSCDQNEDAVVSGLLSVSTDTTVYCRYTDIQ